MMAQFQSLVAVQRCLQTRQSERYRRVPESVVTQKLCRFSFVPSQQPFPERWMEEHVRVVQAFHKKAREHLIKRERRYIKWADTRCEKLCEVCDIAHAVYEDACIIDNFIVWFIL